MSLSVRVMWKNIRVACLLLVLLIVAINAYRDQNQDWNQPINILLHPINADGSVAAQRYIQQLQQDDFAEVKHYLEKNPNFMLIAGFAGRRRQCLA